MADDTHKPDQSSGGNAIGASTFEPLTESGSSPNQDSVANNTADQGAGTAIPAATISAAAFQPLDTSSGQKKKINPLWIAGGAAGLGVAGVLFFLLTARSLQVEVATETPAIIDIDAFSVPIGGRYLIRSGVYDITVIADGYHPYEGSITVGDKDTQKITITPAILPGLVDFDITPAGAAIRIDGELLGTAPLSDQAIDAGSHEVLVSAPRYQTATAEIAVAGRGIDQTVAIALTPDWADISLDVTPANATVSVDGEPVGAASDVLEILAGKHELTLNAEGFKPKTLNIDVTAQQAQQLGPVTLIPADGLATITSSPTGANVSVNGEFMGRTPLTLELKPDRKHRISVAKVGYQRASTELELARGETAERSLTLKPLLGDIQFNIEPAGAELFINGKSVGTGSQTIALPAVEQRVEVKLEGYASERYRVTPRPGLEQQVAVRLLTLSEARKQAMKPEITSALGQTLKLIDPMAEPVNEFQMGASRREPGRRSNEVEHTVRLERAFYMATNETTNAQFRQFLATHDSGQIEGQTLNREHQPAAGISWQQAARFCNWLSAKEGLPLFYREQQGIVVGYNASSTGYRLPTEAEWAFVARIDGEKRYRFSWGDEFPPKDKVTNIADNTSAFVTGRILNGYTDNFIVSAPVKSFPANHRGFYDMNGNVAEWTHDVYRIPSANAEVEVDPLGALQGDNYTVRGASWALSRLSELRLTARDYGAAGRDDLGFRIARYAE